MVATLRAVAVVPVIRAWPTAWVSAARVLTRPWGAVLGRGRPGSGVHV